MQSNHLRDTLDRQSCRGFRDVWLLPSSRALWYLVPFCRGRDDRCPFGPWILLCFLLHIAYSPGPLPHLVLSRRLHLRCNALGHRLHLLRVRERVALRHGPNSALKFEKEL
jgi:hypothetical protein